jgi:hypothetical protein
MENTNSPTICYECIYRRNVSGDCHSRCTNSLATVTGHAHGYKNGWFMHPFNFDPIWLLTCNGYEPIVKP